MNVNASVNKSAVSPKTIVFWVLTIGLPAVILLMPTTEVMTMQIKLYLAITLLCILMFAFENVQQTAVALLLPLLYVVSGVVPASVAFSPWLQYIPWMCLGGLILANVLESTGLLRRVAYKCIIMTGASYNGILWGMALAGIILNVFIPGQVVIPMAAFSFGICQALELGRSKESAGIMMTAAMAALLPLMFIFNTNVLVIYNAAQGIPGITVPGWLEFLGNNCVSVIFMAAMVFIASKLFKPDRPINGKEYFLEQYQAMGKMTSDEKKTAVVALILFLFLLTGKLHGIELGWGFAIIPLLLYFPGLNAGTPEDLKRVNYGFILFIASCMAIGTAAGALGVAGTVANLVMPILAGKGVSFVMFFVWGMCVVLNFLMTPLAIMGAFSGPLAQIAINLGINPDALFMVIYHGVDQIIMPYEYALYLIFVSFGLIRLGDFIKLCSVKMVVNLIFVMVILIPYWRLIGFLTL